MQCPRCSTIMATNDVGSFRHYSCEDCGGHWIPGKMMRSSFDDDSFRKLSNYVSPTHDTPPDCPACNVPLSVSAVQGIEIDHCMKCHGVWFDANELAQLKDSIRPASPLRHIDQRSELHPWTEPLSAGELILQFLVTVLRPGF